MSNVKNEDSKSHLFSTDVSVISMDTDNDDDGDLFLTTKGHFTCDLTESCPDIYRCPISKEMMTRPVMLHDDGHTYDEISLKEWLSENNRSPLTGVDLKNKSYSRNYALQSAIEQFETQRKAQLEEDQHKSHSNMDLSDEKESDLSPRSDITLKLKRFLSAISLDEYVSHFIDAGFVSMTDFANITFNDLISMNIPVIHARRMSKAIDKYNETHGIPSNGSGVLSDVPLTKSIIITPGRIPKSHNSRPLNCNIMLLGDAYVGKTSLRKRLELDDFVMTQATQGVELTCLMSNFQGEDLQITIWDPAGQERYAPITKSYFRRAHAAAIIFAADDNSTWRHVEYWMKELETNAPDDIETMLICNKIDLLTREDQNGEIELSGLIKNAIRVAAKKRIPFYTTSAKSGEAVKQSFQELVSNVLNNQAILDKLYHQRDGTLRRDGSTRSNPYGDREESAEEEEEEKGVTPTPRSRKNGTKRQKLAKLKKKLSWKSRRNQSKEYNEYTARDYDKTIDLDREFSKEHVNGSGGCCSR